MGGHGEQALPQRLDVCRTDGNPVDRADHLEDPPAQREEILVEAGQRGRHGIQEQLAEPLAQDAPAAEDAPEEGAERLDVDQGLVHVEDDD